MRWAGILGVSCLLGLGGGAALAASGKSKEPKTSAAGKAKKSPEEPKASKATSASDAKAAKVAPAKSERSSGDAKVAKTDKSDKPEKTDKSDKSGKSGKGDADAGTTKSGLKIRQGSFLRRTDSEPEPVDLRGDLERRRDIEITRHYTRIAVLDRIAAIAEDQNDGALTDRVEAVRRKETRRYWAAMQELRSLAWLKTVRGQP